MMRFAKAAFAAVLVVACCGAASGAEDSAQLCTAGNDSGIGDAQRLAACTTAIQSGDLTGDALASAHAARGDVYYRLRLYEKALADYNSALAKLAKLDHPAIDPMEIVERRGFDYEMLRRPLRAIADFEQVIAAMPSFAEAYFGRGRAFGQLGAVSRAWDDFDKAIALQPTFVDAYIARGEAFYEMGDYPHALQDLSYAIVIRPKAGEAYFARGAAYAGSAQYDLALRDFASALALMPGDKQVIVQRDLAQAAATAWQQRVAVRRSTAQGAQPEVPPGAPPPPPQAPPDDLAQTMNYTGPSRVIGSSHDCSSTYPPLARRLFETGNVLVTYGVSATGAIQDAGVARSSGSERLDRAAVACVAELWRNTPAMRDGKPVASPGHQAIIQFSMPAMEIASDFATRATGFSALGEYDRAQTDFDRAIALDPKSGKYLYDRGVAKYFAGDMNGAAGDFTAALDVKADARNAQDGLDLIKARRAVPAPVQVPRNSI